MSTVLVAFDRIAAELADILSSRGQSKAGFVSDIGRLLQAYKELLIVDEAAKSPTRNQVIDFLRAAIQAVQTATRIVHLGFNHPAQITNNLKRARHLRPLGELLELYSMAEQATKHPGQMPPFYDDRAAKAALAKVFDDIVEEFDTDSRKEAGHPAGIGLVENFFGAPGDEARRIAEAVEFEKGDALRVAVFVRKTWLT